MGGRGRPDPNQHTAASSFDRDDRWAEPVIRNVEIARDLGCNAIKDGDYPLDVLNRTLDFVVGFLRGTSGLIVPPDMIDPTELAEAVQLGRRLAKEHGW